MQVPSPLTVFDCMLFVEAVTSDRGPAFRCFELAEERRVSLVLSFLRIVDRVPS